MSAKTASARVSTVVFCEEVRQEINNKHILLGVVAGTLLLSSFPANIRGALYLEVYNLKSGKHKFKILIHLGSRLLAQIDGEILFDARNDVAVVAVSQMVLGVQEEGELRAEIIFDDQPKQIFLRRRIKLFVPPST